MRWELLATLDEDDRARVLASARTRRYARNEVIFHEGDTGDTMHLIQSGRVAVKVLTPDGSTATLAILGPGEAFGEMALFRRSAARSATALALEGVVTMTLRKDTFTTLRAEHPGVERVLVAVLASRVDRLSRHLVEALYENVQTRVVRRLHEAALLYRDGDGEVVVPLTQDDIAGLAGTTRPTANGVLRKLEEAGVLSLNRGRIVVLDMSGLAGRTG